MALFAAAAVGAGVLLYAGTVDTTYKDLAAAKRASEESFARPLLEGQYSSFKKYAAADTRLRFVAVKEITDVNGARVFLVDYGTGGKVLQYHDPRVLQ